MVRLRISTLGLDEVVRDLDAIAARLREPLTPLLELAAQDWASALQQNISEGNLDLPDYHPATLAIREYYGHDGKEKLIRGGDLLHSIAPLEFTPDSFTVGTEVEFAKVLQEGGTVTDRRGRPHEVPPWPFIVATDEMVDDLATMVGDYFTLEDAPNG